MSDSTNATQDQQRRPGLNIQALKMHIIQNKVDCGLLAIRFLTMIFALGYFIPSYSVNCYYKALIANAATGALRLHQRMGALQLTKEYFLQLLTEDSFHYLFYSLIFFYVTPVTLALLPVFLFALLHSASYSLTVIDTLGQNAWWGARLLISIVEFQSRNILRLVAFVEIVLMPYTVILILMGRAGLLTPFIYYHFILQRYSSRRNPYTKNMFRELRGSFERFASKPSTPQFVRSIITSMVMFVCKLAPQQ